jgi:hypothetical protein
MGGKGAWQIQEGREDVFGFGVSLWDEAQEAVARCLGWK